MNTLIAVPSVQPGGLDASMDAHFGHCDIYTIASVENGKVTTISTLPNVPHESGGCMAPVNHLAENGVKVLIAGGMGFRPLQGFHQVGINVYHGGGAPSVGAAIEAYLHESLPQFSMEHTCGGGTDHSHEGSCGNHV